LLEDRVAHGIIRAVRHNTRMALLLVSIDGFKRINEEHGHKLGDDALIMVAERLRTAVRQQDTVARVGCDEFAIVLEEVFQQDDADRVTTTIGDALTEPFVLGKKSVHIEVTIGDAFFPENGKEAGSLLMSAGKQIRTIRDRTSASRKNAPGLTIAETARPAMRL
jgi:diguanylate cyclase (GGDEF)-like protein